MSKEVKVNYYSVVPAEIKYNNELTERAKQLIYGEISSLSNKMGYCFATNGYFAKLYKCTNGTIQNAIAKLQECGFVKVEIENKNQRKIYLVSNMEYEEKILDILNKFELIYPKEIVESMNDEIQDKIKTVCYSLALVVKENVSHLLYKMNRDKLFSVYDECKL